MKFANGVPDDLAENLAMLDELGGPTTYNHYPNGWAMAFNTPFKMWKRYEFNGGTVRPVHHLLAGRHRRPGARCASSTTTPSTSCRRSWTCLGVEPPESDQGTHPEPVRRRQHARQLRRRVDAPSARKTQFYSMLGSRGIWHDGLEGRHHPPDDRAAGATSTTTTWELYHIDVDRAEAHDLAAEHPDKLRELVNLWYAEAGANGAFPLDDRSPLEIIMHTAAAADRRHASATSTTPDTAEVPETQAVNIRNRSFTIGALVDIPRPGAEGRALRRWALGSAATPSTSRTTGCTT